ncbi:MAG: DUF2207 domain-containing protein [Kribbellaceae bacterium]
MRRVLAGLLLTIVGGWLFAGLAATSAVAASTTPSEAAAYDDSVDSMGIEYNVTTDGVLEVTERIVYRFGIGSGRHGIYRDLVTREPFVDDMSKDQKYEISDVEVSSPSGDSAEFTKETTSHNGGRDQSLRLKIGSADRTIDADTATYEISYKVRGALRHFDDHSELYWDATGDGWAAELNDVSVDVTVPEGVTRTECFAGPHGSSTACDSDSVSGGTGRFAQANIPVGSQLTIVAGIKAGVVSNDTPIVVDPPSLLERAGLTVPMVAGSGLVALAVPVAGITLARRTNKDERYAGLPPGAFPATGSTVAVGKDTLAESQIPVAFAPPQIPVAEAGLLIDAVANTRETAATLIDLAVRGGIRIDNTGTEQFAVLINPAVANMPHEQALLSRLYPNLQPGTAIPLKRRSTGDQSMRKAHDAMIDAVRQQVTARGYYTRLPSRMRSGGVKLQGFGCACVGMIAIWVFGGTVMAGIGAAVSSGSGGGGRLVAFGLPVLMVLATLGYIGWLRSRGRRTAFGRALTDQTIGFRTYLATAEAQQLRFEEGEDIFSRYLPWAIVFDLADRWQKVCAELVAAGRIPADPVWYSGPSYYTSGFAAGTISDTVARTFDPPPAPANSGGGGGSSSGFGGGSSGGGGGGGGGGSW